MENQEAMDALMCIEDFRNLNDEIAVIIAKSEAVKKAKTREEEQTQAEKREVSEAEKEYKSLRKQVQEKLRKLATRLPVFMYLLDYREYSLVDVIRNIEGALFQKTTGLNVEEFNLLLELGVFNRALMNDAVYKFKRYEDASLEYTGLNMHAGEGAGGFDTAASSD